MALTFRFDDVPERHYVVHHHECHNKTANALENFRMKQSIFSIILCVFLFYFAITPATSQETTSRPGGTDSSDFKDCRNNATTSAYRCMNNARCELLFNRYVCLCPRLLVGARCEVVHPCFTLVAGKPTKDTAKCLHGGECHMIPDFDDLSRLANKSVVSKSMFDRLSKLTKEMVSHKCTCTSDYTGKNCETKINQDKDVSTDLKRSADASSQTCASEESPAGLDCGVGGECILADLGAACKCRARYTGKHCEMLYCPGCANNTCNAKGICLKACVTGFSGPTCENLIGSMYNLTMTISGEFTPELSKEETEANQHFVDMLEKLTYYALAAVTIWKLFLSPGSVIVDMVLVTGNPEDTSEDIVNALKANADKFQVEGYRLLPDSIRSVQVVMVDQEDKEDSDGDQGFALTALIVAVGVCCFLIVMFIFMERRRRRMRSRPPSRERSSNFRTIKSEFA